MSSIDELRDTYNTLYKQTLPALAKARDPAQPKWPVFLDHCFARIILDNAVGIDRQWNQVLKAPATKSMSEEQLHEAIQLGEMIRTGERNLVELDERSLELRGKTKGGEKRKQGLQDDTQSKKVKKNDSKAESRSTDVKEDEDEQQLPTPKPSPTDDTKLDTTPAGKVNLKEVRAQIRAHKGLTPFRQQTLILLSQVPSGRYTTYQALADGIAKTSPDLTGGKKSSARAVGSAMRRNPFAPQVPCHRCLASDGKIGGFQGVWDAEGENAKKKMNMLRDEGVKFDGHGKVVGAPFKDFK